MKKSYNPPPPTHTQTQPKPNNNNNNKKPPSYKQAPPPPPPTYTHTQQQQQKLPRNQPTNQTTTLKQPPPPTTKHTNKAQQQHSQKLGMQVQENSCILKGSPCLSVYTMNFTDVNIKWGRRKWERHWGKRCGEICIHLYSSLSTGHTVADSLNQIQKARGTLSAQQIMCHKFRCFCSSTKTQRLTHRWVKLSVHNCFLS